VSDGRLVTPHLRAGRQAPSSAAIRSVMPRSDHAESSVGRSWCCYTSFMNSELTFRPIRRDEWPTAMTLAARSFLNEPFTAELFGVEAIRRFASSHRFYQASAWHEDVALSHEAYPPQIVGEASCPGTSIRNLFPSSCALTSTLCGANVSDAPERTLF
jgi:hypothetical protein